MIVIALILIILYIIGVYVVLEQAVFKGRIEFLLYYIVTFLPIYVVFQSFTYSNTDLLVVAKVLQFSKEVVLFGGLAGWLLFQRQKLFFPNTLDGVDYLFLLFFSLSFIYLVLPIGSAAITSKLIYFKNLSFMGIAYYLGRKSTFSFKEWRNVFYLIFIITAIAFIVIALEKISGTHFHSLVGFAKYNYDMYENKPVGHYGLTWTFEAQEAQKRFGSIFSNPLEFAASMLLSVSAVMVFAFYSPYRVNRARYWFLLSCALLAIVFALSRASFVAIFGMLILMALIMGMYRLILGGGVLALLSIIYLIFFSTQEVQDFISDTLLFRNSSSLTHLIEWIEAIESIIAHPMGIGLATSGNAGGVEADIKVGGENQFLIMGVQLGVIGMFLYISMIIAGIVRAWQAYRFASSREEQVVPIVAASIKFGLLLPMMTSNAETYLYVSLCSWWMIGYCVRFYQTARNPKFMKA
jgi:hypothetical protein